MSEQKKAPEKKRIIVEDVVNLLKNGYSRYSKDDVGYGSIQEKYNLSGPECKQLFAHPDIRNIKVKVPTLEIVHRGPAEMTAGAAPKAVEEPKATVVKEQISPQPVPSTDEGLFS